MGISGIGIWQLLIILAIVIMLFGSKRLAGLGGDLGTAIRGFRQATKEGAGDEAEQRHDSDNALESAHQNQTTT
ncbi:MAG: twin-arginine translocase TatA/TatE family subunit [Pseudomonadota bacterium]